MIIKASQRGGGAQLASHLLKAENEQVEVHEIRGFISDNVAGAFKEAQAVAQGTRCKQYLFSVSINPPANESVEVSKFESAIERIEQANGLTGQPRVVVFHEKEGRRHAHCVWSRIDAGTMTARQLSHFKLKLREISKGLYLEHGWQMPRGLMDSRDHDPRNFSHAEWQQAKRIGRDPKQLKALMQECWAVSKDKPAFEKALQERGLYLAKGDRRGHVAVTYEGEAVSVARMIGVRSKDVTAKLGKSDDLRSVAKTKSHIAERVAPRLDQLIKIADTAKVREMQPFEQRRQAIAERHTSERQKMSDGQRVRFEAESRIRAERFRSGVAGLWDRLTGKHSAIRKENERDAFNGIRRDRTQRDDLLSDQLQERRGLQRDIVAVRERHASRIQELHRDVARLRDGSEIPRGPSRVAREPRGPGRDGPGLGM